MDLFPENQIPHDLRKDEKCFCLLQDQQDMELIHFCPEAVFLITFPPRLKIKKKKSKTNSNLGRKVEGKFTVHVLCVAEN